MTIFVTALMAGLTVLAKPAIASPSVSAQPASGFPGDEITLSGRGWDPGFGKGEIYLNQADIGRVPPLGSFLPAKDGTFTTTFTVPQVPKGSYTMVACQRCGDPDGYPLATFPFEVTAPTPTVIATPDDGFPGDEITLSGRGWDPGFGKGDIYLNQADIGRVPPLGSFLPAKDGTFTTTFTVPRVPGRSYTMVACQRCGVDEGYPLATFPFHVKAPLEVEAPPTPTAAAVPTADHPGTFITVAGAWWDFRLGKGDIYLNQADIGRVPPLGSFLPAKDGTFTTTFTVPRVPGRSYTMVACQRCGDVHGYLRARFPFVVTPTATATPTHDHPGAIITVTGIGWDPRLGEGAIYRSQDVGLGSSIGSFLPGEDGTFTTTFTVPRVPTGSQTMVACQRCGDPDGYLQATFPFEVKAGPRLVRGLRLSPSRGRLGGRIHVFGQGWSREEGEVRIYINPSSPLTRDPDATVLPRDDGSFEAFFEVPALAGGPYTVLACQHCSGPELIAMRRILAIVRAHRSWIPWAVAWVALLFMIASGLLVRSIHRRKRGRLQARRIRIRTERDEPDLAVIDIGGGPAPSPRHTVRLVPHADRGVQQLEEVNQP